MRETQVLSLRLLFQLFLDCHLLRYFMFAEGQAMRRKSVYMKDWIKKSNSLLKVNERDILCHAGKIAHEGAKTLAEKEYDKFQIKRIKTDDKKKRF